MDNGYVVLKMDENSQNLLVRRVEEKKVCEVCGYPNEKDTIMCKNCSNYFKANGEK